MGEVKVMKKFMKIILVFVISCSFLVSQALASESNDRTKIGYLITPDRPLLENVSVQELVDKLNQSIEKYYHIRNYYRIRNLNGFSLNEDLYTNRCLIVYGTPQVIPDNEFKNGRYRFFGQTMMGEAYVNELFPMDAWSGGFLNDRAWIPSPWDNNVTYRGGKIKSNDITNAINTDPTLRSKINKAIHIGLSIFYGNKYNAFSSNPLDKIYDESRGASTDWAQYVHILQPPTDFTWGMGVMFHRLGGKYWYKTVPIAPFQLSQGSGQGGNESSQGGQGGGNTSSSQSVNLTAKFTKYVTGIPVGQKYTYQATFSNSGREAVQTDIVWRVDGKQVRTKSVTIPAQGSVSDELTYAAAKEGMMILEVEVNPGRNKPGNETRWDDNKAKASVMVIGSDTGKPGEGEVYLSE